ncbi:MAG: hypothetical protein LBJ73_05055 [Rickettsiales bacterium]|nr:hypothetical protein [Rickettsiales bacterium]
MSASSPSPGACSARSTEYRCKGGYYGTSTNCIACPQNSTCPAGTTTPSCNTGYYYKFLTCNACPENSVCNATDFVCNEGYIKDRMFQSSCILCPRNATCPAGSTTPTCNAGYYTYTAPSKEYSCARCAAADGVYTNIELTIKAYGTNAAGTGKTSASCKLPAGTYYDEIGTFTHTEDCEYTPSTT